MKEIENKTRTVQVNLDLSARMTGFGSASMPTPAHQKIMRIYASPLLLGPEPSDLLLEMVTHMYTEEEAEIVQHLPPIWPRTASKAASLAGWTQADAERVLDRLSFVKSVVLAFGKPRKYTLLPIVPGTFEMALMTADLSTRNDWHRKFSVLFEKLWETGYTAQYPGNPKRPLIRYLPVGRISPTLQSAWPSDKLDEIFEPFTDFAVGHCQCRLSMRYIGKSCGKPTENCVAFGNSANTMIERNLMRRIDRQEAIAIKREAERAKCVSWMMNRVDPKEGGGSCSCCGCCCHALRTVKNFSQPGMISLPHFMPMRVPANCDTCLACVKACPMDAWTVSGGVPVFSKSRCIGCGLCVVACKRSALTLAPVQGAAHPGQKGLANPLIAMLPDILASSTRVYLKRLFSGS